MFYDEFRISGRRIHGCMNRRNIPGSVLTPFYKFFQNIGWSFCFNIYSTVGHVSDIAADAQPARFS